MSVRGKGRGGVVIPVSGLCNSSCGKVTFSQACVKNSVHGGGVS